MQRRKFIAGMGSLAAAGAAGIGTGAFTNVRADRTVQVDTAGDRSAFLAFEKASEGQDVSPNAEEYVKFSGTSGDQLTLSFESTIEGGEGLNKNASTTFDDLFDIVNQGTQEIEVAVENDSIPDGVQVYAENGSDAPTTADTSLDYPYEDEPNNQTIEVGEQITNVGLKFNEGWDQSTLPFTITIRADAVNQD